MKKSPYVVINCAALTILAFAAWYLARTHSTGHLRVTTVVPANGVPEAVAISPDGNSVAMMYRESFTSDGSSTTEAIEVHDIRSGRVDRFSLPQASWGRTFQYYVSPPLRYCDGGKYLLAFNGPDTLSVVDVRTLQLHTSIALSSLPKRMAGLGRAVLDCSAESSVAALADENPEAMGASMLVLLDLDNGTEIADLSDSLKGRYQGDGIAISPNGTQLALATWRFGAGEGSGEPLHILQ